MAENPKEPRQRQLNTLRREIQPPSRAAFEQPAAAAAAAAPGRSVRMEHRVLVLLIALAGCVLAPRPARADLDSFMRKPEPAYRWEKTGEQEMDGCKVY